jgi:hypothetical protein
VAHHDPENPALARDQARLDLVQVHAIGARRRRCWRDEASDGEIEKRIEVRVVQHPDHGLELALQPGTEGRRRRAGW